MSRLSTLTRLLAMAALGLTLTGCVVLPFGGGRGHYERGHRHYVDSGAAQGVQQPGRDDGRWSRGR
jgi:hypothetical protein